MTFRHNDLVELLTTAHMTEDTTSTECQCSEAWNSRKHEGACIKLIQEAGPRIAQPKVLLCASQTTKHVLQCDTCLCAAPSFDCGAPHVRQLSSL